MFRIFSITLLPVQKFLLFSLSGEKFRRKKQMRMDWKLPWKRYFFTTHRTTVSDTWAFVMHSSDKYKQNTCKHFSCLSEGIINSIIAWNSQLLLVSTILIWWRLKTSLSSYCLCSNKKNQRCPRNYYTANRRIIEGQSITSLRWRWRHEPVNFRIFESNTCGVFFMYLT